jgi:hypothetical protein
VRKCEIKPENKMLRCPGQDQRFWKPEDIFEVECSNCGKTVEFFKDEPKLKCRNCGHLVINPKVDLGCAEWCQYAEQCVGVDRENLGSVCDQLINQMKNIFGSDTKRINHALSVLNFAEKIQAAEGGDALIVKASAILHDIGIHEAERKYNSSAGKYQEIEGPPIAEKILKSCNIPAGTIEHICRIIANHHTAKNIDTTEFRIIWDADNLVNLQEEFKDANRERIERIIKKVFKTSTGHRMASEILIKN